MREKNFGKNLRLARVNKGYTQEQLANMIGLSKQAITMYETNKRTPKNSALRKIASILEVSLDFLLDNAEKTSPKLQELSSELPMETLTSEENEKANNAIEFVELFNSLFSPEELRILIEKFTKLADFLEGKI